MGEVLATSHLFWAAAREVSTRRCRYITDPVKKRNCRRLRVLIFALLTPTPACTSHGCRTSAKPRWGRMIEMKRQRLRVCGSDVKNVTCSTACPIRSCSSTSACTSYYTLRRKLTSHQPYPPRTRLCSPRSRSSPPAQQAAIVSMRAAGEANAVMWFAHRGQRDAFFPSVCGWHLLEMTGQLRAN
jgi:hypothetical protein